MAAGESEITIDEQLVDHLNITIQAHTSVQSLSKAGDQKTLLKAGLLTSLVAIGGILNPPIPPTINKAHAVLSMIFSLAIFVNLAIGISQILLSMILHRVPRLICAVIKLTELGLVLMRITLGFGTSVVLMVTSSPWFVLYVVFLSIQFM